MKKFMNLPFEGGLKQVELVDNYTWQIVEVHYDGQEKAYRAVKLDEANAIKFERIFKTKEQAEDFVAKQ